jgi:hypothetical protein
VKIKKIVVHGLKTTSSKLQAPKQKLGDTKNAARRVSGLRASSKVGLGSAAHWPPHEETHGH